MLNQQNRRSGLVDFLNDLKNLVDQDWSQTHAGLVKQKQFGLGHQAAAHRKHLKLAAAQGSANLRDSLFKAGEQFKDLFHVGLDSSLVVSRKGAHFQIVADAKIQENAPSFRHLNQAAADYLVRRQICDVLALKLNLSAALFDDVRHGVKRRRLSGSVRANQRNYFAPLNVKADFAQGVYRAVAD